MTDPLGHPGRALYYPIVIAVVLHTGLAIAVPPRFEVDSAIYQAQAEGLVAHGASLDPNGQPETRVPPGYPLFVAAFLVAGLGYEGTIVAQHAIWIALVAAVVWLVWRASRRSSAAVTAGVITALDLPGVQSSLTVLSETLAAALLLAAVVCTLMAIRSTAARSAAWWSIAAGGLAGMTALVRPIAMLLGLPLAIAIVAAADRRRRFAGAAALLAASLVLPGLWTLRNAREAGVATMSSLGGINLLYFRAAGTLAIRDPGGIEANLLRRREELEQRACRQLEADYQRPCASLSWAERSGQYAATALPVILGDPIATGRQAARGLAMIVFGGGASLLSELTGISERAARGWCLVYTVPLAVLAVAGIPYWWRRDREVAWLAVLVIAYMFGMALGAEAYSRFRVPVIALYAILCGGGVAWLRDSTPHRAKSARWGPRVRESKERLTS